MRKEVPFGEYLLLEPIKAGGMSQVWRARPQGAATVVAIKRVLPMYAQDPEVLGLFLDEARVSVQLSHPNIARVFDLGRVGAEPYIAMEYLPGVDLRAVFWRASDQGSAMPIPLVLFVLARICEALDYAHRRADTRGAPLRIVHRDVAPDNCLMTFDGDVKLVDFGVAKAASQSSKTRAGTLKGKLGYMSPEQVLGKDVDRRSDLFSLGVVLWEMVTGRRLFARDNPLQAVEAVRSAVVEPPSRVNPKVPPALERVILEALARDRDQRPAWASEMGDGLRACLAGLSPPPTAAHLRRYLSLMFVDELRAERERRTEWARVHLAGRGAARPRAPGSRPGDRSAQPTVMEMRAVGAPAPPTVSEMRAIAMPPPPPAAPDDDEVDTEDRPTLLDARARLAGLEVPDALMGPDVDLPPPMPSPEGPTKALEAFVRGPREADDGSPTGPVEDTAPMSPAKRRRPAPLEGTAPPALAPRKPPKR